QAFDSKRLQMAGDPLPVAEQVAALPAPYLGSLFSASENGVLCYHEPAARMAQLAWYDRSGKRLALLGEPGGYTNPALSPDEKRLAVDRCDPQTNRRDIWVFDLARGTSTRLTFDPAEDVNSVWSPDGSRIAFSSERKGYRDIYQKPASGAGGDELVLESKANKSLEDWSRDGRYMIFTAPQPATGVDVWVLPVSPGAERKLAPLLQDPAAQDQAQISPDGRWIAYRSTESGRPEVYVQAFPPSGGKWQVSTAGGTEPRWRGDGKELFYVAGTKLMAVEVKASGSSFEAGAPKALFEARLVPDLRRNRFVVTADGKRFLVRTEAGDTSSPITVVVNWPAALKR
ncbi:MAG: hypothetical protein AAB225_05980, partial [Acidobacteriota bacterium]